MSITETTNPLREGLPRPRTAPPCAMVIFGATGDLARRKLVPALYNLARAGHLPAGFSVVGFARSAGEDAGFRAVGLSGPGAWGGRQPAVLPGDAAKRDCQHLDPTRCCRARSGARRFGCL